MVLRDLQEIMLGSQRLKIYIDDWYEPVFIGYNSSIDDAILNKQIDFITPSVDEKECILVQLESR